MKEQGEDVELPSYLEPFKYKKEDKEANSLAFNLLKSGEYNLEEEEEVITSLRKAIGQRGNIADKLFEKLGLFGLLKKRKQSEQRKKALMDQTNMVSSLTVDTVDSQN